MYDLEDPLQHTDWRDKQSEIYAAGTVNKVDKTTEN